MTVADEADAVDDPGKRRVSCLNDPDRFGADHGDDGRETCLAANRLSAARQHEMAVRDRRFDNVRRADEFGHEAILRLEINLARRADLRDPAFLHDHDPVAQFHGFRLIVGHIDRRDAQRPQQTVEFAAQPVSKCRVERRQRLVKQQDAGPDRDRPRKRDALALTAGELIDAAVLKPADIGQ